MTRTLLLATCALVLIHEKTVEPVFLEKYLYGTSLTHSIWYNTDTIAWLDGTERTPTVLSIRVGTSSEHAYLGCSYHKQLDYLVLNDVEVGSISAIGKSSNAIQATIAYWGTSQGVGHLDVDWLSGNVYWSDSGFKWIAVQKLPTSFSQFSLANDIKVIVDSYLDVPSGVATDPSQRFLFWTDTGKLPKIERSNLDGQSRMILVWSALSKPVTIIINFQDKHLYWADSAKGTVESCDYYGQHRKILVSDTSSNFYGLALYGKNLITTIPSTKSIRVYSTESWKVTRDISFRNTNPYSICMVTEENQPTTAGVCDPTTCAHICLKTPSGTKCICEDGYKLAGNGRDCIANTNALERSLIFTKGNEICALPITKMMAHKHSPIAPNCSVGGLPSGAITYLALHTATDEMFFTVGDTIYRQKFFESTALQIYSTKAQGNIRGLDFDWINGQLYWIEENFIYKCVVNNNRHTSLTGQEFVIRNINSPRSLAVDPIGKKLYWLSGTGIPRIESADLSNTTNRWTVIQSGLVDPQFMTYSRTMHRLFWTEGGQMGTIRPDGTEVNIQSATSSETYKGISAYKDFLLWIAVEGSKSTLHVQDRSTKDFKSSLLTLAETQASHSIVAYDKVTQPAKNEPCIHDNGGCSQICLTDDLGKRCKCELGYTLQADNKMCKTDHSESNYFLVIDSLNDNIYQIHRESMKLSHINILKSNKPVTLSVDTSRNLLYWTDSYSNSIKVSFLNGTGERTYTGTGTTASKTLAIDHTSGNVYFVKDNSIAVMLQDGTKVKTNLVTGTVNVQSLTLHPRAGKMYWIERGNTPVIKKANMDGSDVGHLVQTEVKSPMDITLDETENTLFWCDNELDKIEKISLENNQRTTIQLNTGDKPTAIKVDGSYLFYINADQRSITRISKENGVGATKIFTSTEVGRLTSLYIFFNFTQGHSICSNDNGCCSQICLPKGPLRTCACSDGTNINSDMKTCSNDLFCPKAITNGKEPTGCLKCTGQVHTDSQCGFSCKDGFVNKDNITTVHCNPFGQWKENVNQLCIRLCDGNIKNGQIENACSRKAGVNCAFTCKEGFKSSINTVRCQNSGHWEYSDSACEKILCSVSLANGQYVSPCSAEVGVSCDITCSTGHRSAVTTVTCQATGKWDKEVMCKPIENTSLLGLYIGVTAGGILVLIIVVTVVMCVLIRRTKKDNVNSHNPRPIYLEALSRPVVENNKEDEEVYTTIDEGAMGGHPDIVPPEKNKVPDFLSRKASLDRYTSFPMEEDYQKLDHSVGSYNTEYHSIKEPHNGPYFTDNSANTSYPSGSSGIRRSTGRGFQDSFARGNVNNSESNPDYLHPTMHKRWF